MYPRSRDGGRETSRKNQAGFSAKEAGVATYAYWTLLAAGPTLTSKLRRVLEETQSQTTKRVRERWESGRD